MSSANATAPAPAGSPTKYWPPALFLTVGTLSVVGLIAIAFIVYGGAQCLKERRRNRPGPAPAGGGGIGRGVSAGGGGDGGPPAGPPAGGAPDADQDGGGAGPSKQGPVLAVLMPGESAPSYLAEPAAPTPHPQGAAETSDESLSEESFNEAGGPAAGTSAQREEDHCATTSSPTGRARP